MICTGMPLSGQKYQAAAAAAIKAAAAAPYSKGEGPLRRTGARSIFSESSSEDLSLWTVIDPASCRPQCFYHGPPGSANGGENPAQQRDRDGPDHAQLELRGGDGQVEDHVAEQILLAVIQRPGDQSSDQSAGNRQRDRLQDHRDGDGEGAITQRAQGGDLAAPG